MHVTNLEARIVRIPLRKPVKHASHTRTETDNVIVRCTLDDGSVGHGEGVPREYVTGETAESAVRLIQESNLDSVYEDCRSFIEAVQMAERMQLAAVPGDDRNCAGNAARCAVELAVLDAFGRAFGEPLMAVTNVLTPALYAPTEWVQYSGAILSARGWKARAMAWGMRMYGFGQLKVKVGIAGHDDPGRLKIIRGRVGSKMDLRIDANEAWPANEAADRIRALEPFKITSVEQPVRHEDVACLAAVRKQVRTPVMLDESLCSHTDAERAATGGWCDLFNLRLSKCGGFIPSLRLATFAKRSNLGYQLGCQVGETAILSAAGRHFATSVTGIRYLEGSFDRHLVHEALGTTDITFRRGGWGQVLTGCGLGIDIDAARLDAVTVRRETILG